MPVSKKMLRTQQRLMPCENSFQKVAAKCSRVLYIVDGNIKGEYKSPVGVDVSEKERERMLNNWLLELGW